ncbi:glycosyltransferase [Paratractidigestivibacter sp.]|uniref:glycosyltransferase n=1 Tax=Paratractidigestivibacter sp. TaxID=2847316 RepID=UPI002AC8E053|nr:glycosyltransferase [Paratractidigestivibacter sp.]
MSTGTQLKYIDTGSMGDIVLGHKPRVGVLMSAYNGNRYLMEQIETIAAQEGVDVVLYVRDDGSRDETREMLVEVSRAPMGCITSWIVDLGDNVGFLGSFEKLLMSADGCDFYAFSDQDDFWLPNKLACAVAALETSCADLYASSVEVVDESLSPIGRNDFPGLAYTIPAELIRHRLAGHNMVWTAGLQRGILRLGSLPCWSHDQHVVLASLLADKGMVFDKASYVLHRRLRNSVTPGGAGLAKRLRHEFRMMWNPGLAWNRAALAGSILELGYCDLRDSDMRFLLKCANRKRLSLVRDPSFDCGLALGNFEARLSVMLGRF